MTSYVGVISLRSFKSWLALLNLLPGAILRWRALRVADPVWPPSPNPCPRDDISQTDPSKNLKIISNLNFYKVLLLSDYKQCFEQLQYDELTFSALKAFDNKLRKIISVLNWRNCFCHSLSKTRKNILDCNPEEPWYCFAILLSLTFRCILHFLAIFFHKHKNEKMFCFLHQLMNDY